MTADTLKDLESAEQGTRIALAELLDNLNYNADGLLPAIAQDARSGEVLMLAWMDRTAIERTLNEGLACYFSRSRNSYWQKGESSGHFQTLIDMRFDCDGDTVLLRVEQSGPACHTNRPNCFYLQVDGDVAQVISAPG